MQLDSMVLLDPCILMSSMTRFTGDIPKTLTHFYYLDPSESSGKFMHAHTCRIRT